MAVKDQSVIKKDEVTRRDFIYVAAGAMGVIAIGAAAWPLALFGVQLDPETAHKIALPVAFVVITFLHIVLGELAPKSLAIQKSIVQVFEDSVIRFEAALATIGDAATELQIGSAIPTR